MLEVLHLHSHPPVEAVDDVDVIVQVNAPVLLENQNPLLKQAQKANM